MEFPIRRIGLFGSVARGTDRAESDLDIMLEFYDNDDTTVVCGVMDAKKILATVINQKLDVNDYPISNFEPHELIWLTSREEGVIVQLDTEHQIRD